MVIDDFNRLDLLNDLLNIQHIHIYLLLFYCPIFSAFVDMVRFARYALPDL